MFNSAILSSNTKLNGHVLKTSKTAFKGSNEGYVGYTDG